MTVVGFIPKQSTPNMMPSKSNANDKPSKIESPESFKTVTAITKKQTKSASRLVTSLRPWQQRLKRENAATGLNLSERKPAGEDNILKSQWELPYNQDLKVIVSKTDTSNEPPEKRCQTSAVAHRNRLTNRSYNKQSSPSDYYFENEALRKPLMNQNVSIVVGQTIARQSITAMPTNRS